MEERRFDTRKLINIPVRLYHPELGRMDGIIDNISEGGVALKLNSSKELNIELMEAPLLLRPINMDVLFSVSCLRQTESALAVKFIE